MSLCKYRIEKPGKKIRKTLGGGGGVVVRRDPGRGQPTKNVKLEHCQEQESRVTYKDVGSSIGLNTGLIVHLHRYTILNTTVYRVELSPNHTITVYSLSLLHTQSVVHYTRTESSWSALPLVLGYRLPTADVPLS
jgi:hypothetical protein